MDSQGFEQLQQELRAGHVTGPQFQIPQICRQGCYLIPPSLSIDLDSFSGPGICLSLLHLGEVAWKLEGLEWTPRELQPLFRHRVTEPTPGHYQLWLLWTAAGCQALIEHRQASVRLVSNADNAAALCFHLQVHFQPVQVTPKQIDWGECPYHADQRVKSALPQVRFLFSHQEQTFKLPKSRDGLYVGLFSLPDGFYWIGTEKKWYPLALYRYTRSVTISNPNNYPVQVRLTSPGPFVSLWPSVMTLLPHSQQPVSLKLYPNFYQRLEDFNGQIVIEQRRLGDAVAVVQSIMDQPQHLPIRFRLTAAHPIMSFPQRHVLLGDLPVHTKTMTISIPYLLVGRGQVSFSYQCRPGNTPQWPREQLFRLRGTHQITATTPGCHRGELFFQANARELLRLDSSDYLFRFHTDNALLNWKTFEVAVSFQLLYFCLEFAQLQLLDLAGQRIYLPLQINCSRPDYRPTFQIKVQHSTHGQLVVRASTRLPHQVPLPLITASQNTPAEYRQACLHHYQIFLELDLRQFLVVRPTAVQLVLQLEDTQYRIRQSLQLNLNLQPSTTFIKHEQLQPLPTPQGASKHYRLSFCLHNSLEIPLPITALEIEPDEAASFQSMRCALHTTLAPGAHGYYQIELVLQPCQYRWWNFFRRFWPRQISFKLIVQTGLPNGLRLFKQIQTTLRMTS